MMDVNQNNQRQIFIEPSDVFLFRDGRPFSAGEGHRARSIFPPTPNTMQGVIRSKILSDRCGRYQTYKNGCNDCQQRESCTIPEEVGRPAQNGQGSYGNLQIRGAIVAKYKQQSTLIPYFPVPADVVEVKKKSTENNSEQSRLRFLQPLQQQLYGTNDLIDSEHSKLLPLWTPETIPIEGIQAYWQQAELENYLLQEHQSINGYIKIDELYGRESRYGIEINNALQTVSEGKLYQTEFIRCQQGVGLYVEIEGINELSGNLIAIGGENRAAQCWHLAQRINWESFILKLKDYLEKSGNTDESTNNLTRFKIYFATPTFFKQGWLPSWLNSNTLEGKYVDIKRKVDIKIKLVAASIPRYQTIGGWDVAYNRPKPTYRAIPPGSVYYCTTDAKPEDIIKAFHWQNITEEINDAQIGFGLALVGGWNYLNIS